MNALVSVIVPVYNIEKYLDKCILSILHQTYHNLEIILIDDGSSDRSPRICDRYARKDNRVQVKHCVNAGVSSARNIGLDMAQGEYIVFADGDDWLPKDAVENLVRGIEYNNADFCYGATKEIYLLKNRISNILSERCIDLSDVDGIIEYIENINKGPWGKIYRKALLKSHDIRFSKDIKYAEDAIFLMQYLQKCETYCSISDTVYNYNRMVFNSASRKQYEEIALWEYIKVSEMEKVFSGNSAKENVISYLLENFYFSLYGRCREIVRYSLNVENAINEICRVCTLYKEKIEELHSRKIAVSKSCCDENFDLFIEYIKECNYKGIYDHLKKEPNKAKVENVMKIALRKLLVNIKTFFCFRLFK